MFAGMGLSYVTGSALLVCSVWEYSGGSNGGGWVPRRTRSQLAAAAGLGLGCALFALLLSWLHLRSSSDRKGHGSNSNTPTQLYRPVDNSSSSGVREKIDYYRIVLSISRGLLLFVLNKHLEKVLLDLYSTN